jgi:hypothetical protein
MSEYEFKDILDDQDPPKRGVVSHLNPKNWGVPDYTSESSFNQAFKKASDSGAKEFMYGDTRHSTEKRQTKDLSDSPNFNTAFRSARKSGDPDFIYNTKRYSTKLVDQKVNENYKNAKDYIRRYIQKQPFSVSSEDSSKVVPPKGQKEWPLTKQQIDDVLKSKSDDIRSKSMSDFNKKTYVSITEQKGKEDRDGFYSPGENKLFIHSKSDDPELYTVPVHELAHKAGFITRSPLPKDSGNKYLSDPRERAARHISTRYFLESQGHKFDKFTDKEFKVLKDAEESLPYDIDQLVQLYGSKNEFIKQMNIPLGYEHDTGFEEKYNFDDILD